MLGPERLRVLGLDLSFTRTGSCLWDGEVATPGHFASVGPNLINRAQSVRDHIKGVWGNPPPDLTILETPVTRSFNSGDLTGLYFIVMEGLLAMGKPVICISNTSVRRMVGMESLRGKKDSERKAIIVAKAREILGERCPPKIVHDEADAFLMAYCAHRFWSSWKLGNPQLSDVEKEVWFSEDPTVKVPKKPRKIRKRAPPLKKRGVIHREGEFLFLPPTQEPHGSDPV